MHTLNADIVKPRVVKPVSAPVQKQALAQPKVTLKKGILD